ncbi:aromatic amino acid transport family protein [Escherichia coli]
MVKSFLGTKQHGIIEFYSLVFSNLAVASSFFGVTLGLFDYLADLFKIDNSHGGRFKTVLLTFLPPALLYLIFPNGFYLRDRRCRAVRHHLGGGHYSRSACNQSSQEVSQSDVHGLGRQSYSGDCHSLWYNRDFCAGSATSLTCYLNLLNPSRSQPFAGFLPLRKSLMSKMATRLILLHHVCFASPYYQDAFSPCPAF